MVKETKANLWPKMTALCNTFPSLRNKPGTDPWDPVKLAHYMGTSGAGTSGSLAAARFVLAVFNTTAEWKELANDERPGRFTLRDLQSFDGDHMAAFSAWARAPWFC
jgi:hypothetical protein